MAFMETEMSNHSADPRSKLAEENLGRLKKRKVEVEEPKCWEKTSTGQDNIPAKRSDQLRVQHGPLVHEEIHSGLKGDEQVQQQGALVDD